MLGLDLQKMRIELMRGGVAPKTIERTLQELSGHYNDLRDQALSEGLPVSEASAKALASIGDEKTILKEILMRPELKSLSGRFPKLVFLFGPTLAAVFTILVFAFSMLALGEASSWSMENGGELAMAEKLLIEGLLGFNCYLLTPLLAIATVRFAKQRMTHFRWPAVGIVLLAVMGSGFAYSIGWPTASEAGTLSINWGYSFLPRAIRGDHDLLNLMQILVTLTMATYAWRIYQPEQHGATELSS